MSFPWRLTGIQREIWVEQLLLCVERSQLEVASWMPPIGGLPSKVRWAGSRPITYWRYYLSYLAWKLFEDTPGGAGKLVGRGMFEMFYLACLHCDLTLDMQNK